MAEPDKPQEQETEEQPQEREDVLGYPKTQWDCPQCDFINEREGHAGGADSCNDCGLLVEVDMVS